MDPLTITTGVIAIFQATNVILSICYRFRAAVKNAPWSLTRLIIELKSLRAILEGLEELTNNIDEPSATQTLISSVLSRGQYESLLTSCQQELDFVRGKIRSFECLDAATSSKRKSAMQALRWEVKAKDINECLQRIERCKSSLSLALDYDQSMMLRRIQDSSISMQKITRSIEQKVAMITEQVETQKSIDEKTGILQWLSPIDPFENHETAVSSHQPGTSSWFFKSKDFDDWYQNKASFLWLTGIPGAGKTVLFSSIINHVMDLRKETSDVVGIAYFYCDFTRADAQDARNVAGSLLAQLCAQVKVPEEIKSAYKPNEDSASTRQRPTWDILKKGLQFISESGRILLLLDALDEVDKSKDLLDFLSWMQQDISNVSILVTSRASSEVEKSLQCFHRFRLESHLPEVEHDIGTYIRQRLNADANLSKYPTDLRNEIQNALLEKCGGMFRWAQCQLDVLSHLRTENQIRGNLHRLPQSLNEIYANILKKVPDNDLDILRSVLLWVGIAVLPLTVEQLCEAIAMDKHATTLQDIKRCRLLDPGWIFDIAGCLLNVTELGHVRFAHLSVKDYLLSRNILEDSRLSMFHLDPKQANAEATFQCLAYLSLDILTTGPAETEVDWNERLESLPILDHVSRAWTYYLRKAASSSELKDLVFKMFEASRSPTFMSWIQVINTESQFKWYEYPRHATPLYYAASFGLDTIVDQLLEEGVDIDAPGSRFKGTALHGATLREHEHIVERLLQAGAQPSKADKHQVTPLHTAAKTGNPKITKLLLEYGASKEALDTMQKTPIDWALEAEKVVSQKILRGEDFDDSDVPQRTSDSPVYERSAASFPALAVAQGLAPHSSLPKL